MWLASYCSVHLTLKCKIIHFMTLMEEYHVDEVNHDDSEAVKVMMIMI